MYSLTMNFSNHVELAAFVAMINPVVGDEPPKRGPGRPPKDNGAAVSAAAASPSPSPAAPSPAAPAAPKVVKYEDSGIGDMLKKAAADPAKKPKAVALLNEMGAVKEGKVSGQHLKPEQYDDFKAKLQAIMDAPAEEEPIG